MTIDDYAADTRAWIAAIRAKTGVPCVWVLGHSEGGLVALDTAAARPAGLCGVIAVSTPGRPLGEVMRAQLHANPANAPLLPDADRAIDALEAGRDHPRHQPDAAAADAVRRRGPAVSGQQLCQGPAKLAAATAKPLLIVQGESDLQVTVEDAKILKAAQPKATLVLLPKVNHVLKTVEGDSRGANLATNADPEPAARARCGDGGGGLRHEPPGAIKSDPSQSRHIGTDRCPVVTTPGEFLMRRLACLFLATLTAATPPTPERVIAPDGRETLSVNGVTRSVLIDPAALGIPIITKSYADAACMKPGMIELGFRVGPVRIDGKSAVAESSPVRAQRSSGGSPLPSSPIAKGFERRVRPRQPGRSRYPLSPA